MPNINNNIRVSQITPGRFHHFHLARQLQRFGVLDKIFTGYPKFKLKDEQGIPDKRIKCFPWLQTLYMGKEKLGLANWSWFDKELAWKASEALDKYTARNLKYETHLIALSSTGFHSGQIIKRNGGIYICDRGSSHIQYQDNILHEEHKRYDLTFKGIDPRIIEKELQEYELADFITIPSEFVKRSFLTMGVSESKLIKIPYGARLDRFSKVNSLSKSRFTVLWVGGVSIRKGFMYALEAFNQLKHSNKEFVVIGAITEDFKSILKNENLQNVVFKGIINNSQLPQEYSCAQVFILSSIEEGLAMVQGEALACGCPIIASENTGANDLFENGKEGFIVPIRNSNAIAEKLQLLADNPSLRQEMSSNALNRVNQIGGWDNYGDEFFKLLNQK